MKTANLRETLLEAALPHVVFDGWSAATFAAAVSDSGAEPALAAALFPRKGLDLACAYHQAGDALLRRALREAPFEGQRFRDKIAGAVRLRLSFADREAVRRGTALFALPQNAPDGARLIWGTVDTIWSELGDISKDGSWYTKRATLAAVYAATVLFWLGDDSPEHAATAQFLDRRIEAVMRFEKTKADLRQNPITRHVMAGPAALLARLRAPAPRDDLPGRDPAQD